MLGHGVIYDPPPGYTGSTRDSPPITRFFPRIFSQKKRRKKRPLGTHRAAHNPNPKPNHYPIIPGICTTELFSMGFSIFLKNNYKHLGTPPHRVEAPRDATAGPIALPHNISIVEATCIHNYSNHYFISSHQDACYQVLTDLYPES